MAKEYHIVYGDNAKGNLLQSGYVDFNSPDVSLIYLMDNLGEGVLFDLRSLNGINDRIQWFEDFYEQRDTYYFRDQLAIEVLEQLNKIVLGDIIYIWLGLTIDDAVWNAAILHFLKDKVANIYVIDFSTFYINNSEGVDRKIPSIGVLNSKQIYLAKDKFRMLRIDEWEESVKRWDSLLKNNRELRILNLYDKIEEVNLDYFDELIIGLCTTDKEYKDSISVIVDIWETNLYWGLGDDFIIERIRKLVRNGILEIKDHKLESLKERKFYVRKPLC